ncbi:MAG: hypothetical protein AAFQ66_22650, partial [Pseudomonadota bacterium]
DRRVFARHFREVFSQEFDAMRAQLGRRESESSGWGWLGWEAGIYTASQSIGAFLSTIVLAFALGIGRSLLPNISVPKWMKGKSAAAKLEDEISETRAKVDQALEEIRVQLHGELYSHAYRGQPPGQLTGMDYDAWPLPENVRTHLNDRTSSSWW